MLIPDFSIWRSRRDLNPRYPFGVHTISSRARYDHFDTAPWVRHSRRLAYNTICDAICQALFLHFFDKVFRWNLRHCFGITVLLFSWIDYFYSAEDLLADIIHIKISLPNLSQRNEKERKMMLQKLQKCLKAKKRQR